MPFRNLLPHYIPFSLWDWFFFLRVRLHSPSTIFCEHTKPPTADTSSSSDGTFLTKPLQKCWPCIGCLFIENGKKSFIHSQFSLWMFHRAQITVLEWKLCVAYFWTSSVVYCISSLVTYILLAVAPELEKYTKIKKCPCLWLEGKSYVILRYP